MKIAYDAKRFFQNASGLGNYSRDLVRILATNFTENQYLLFNKKKTERGAQILELPEVTFVELRGGTLARQFRMGKQAQDAGAELFHGLSGELPLRWHPTPVKKIVTIHDLIFMRYPQFYSLFDRKMHLWKFRKAAQGADRIIAISEQTKQDIVHFLKVPESKVTVVYQGCHHAFQERKTEDVLAAVRAKFALPDRFILSVGTVEKRKNLLKVLRAITGTAIPLVVVGKKTKYFKLIQKYILKNKMEDQVWFPEEVNMEELSSLYQLADVFVYPSLFEGFGIPVIEALYSGTAVVTSNTSCLPEAGGPHSMYIDPENHLDLRAKIIFLWENDAERVRRAEKSLEFVQKFNDDRVAEAVMAVYQSVLKEQ
ncbi:glycosyltransferase family 4 protein [Chryseobacterium sp. MFBS3-17]|uniref:glycosyltransferase family 4 protein n=1 Tax=Chryseobacterium sp. MFBS3-17 TaxID=2886689 RepID=UPI001D0E0DEE|nr:glycosyltransferase family 1 protein [Chryseobacterium sp. MFBS3-17]MCC2591639.1 glycosyltransferase family 4 protein [Chryseobacterium sp. MFBS3-17]